MATSSVEIRISSTTENVSFHKNFWKDSCIRERKREAIAEAMSMQRKPIMYFKFETLVGPSELSLTATSAADNDGTTTELRINTVNFCEFMKYEKTATNINWVAQSRE